MFKQLVTQSSSKPVFKDDKLDNNTLTEVYNQFNDQSISLDRFKEFCTSIVRSGQGQKPTIDKIANAIETTNSRYMVCKKTQDFIMAGMGLKV